MHIKKGRVNLLMHKNKPLKQNIIMIVCCIIFFITTSLIRVISNNNIVFQLGSFYLESGGINGVISQLIILMLIWLEINIKKAYPLCMTLITIFIGTMFIPIFATKSFESAPGIAMALGGICTLIVIHKYMKKISFNEDKLKNIANTDYLTKLPNRRDLMNVIDSLMENNEKFALVFIDIDNFKKINDTLGHDSGDNVLCKVAERWNSIKDDNDYIARLGGDEFALIIQNYLSEESLHDHVKKFSEYIQQKLIINERNIFISASFGIICSSQCDETKQMLKFADIAMYNAKFQPKNKICFFREEMKSEVENTVSVENLIRSALESDRFFLTYQPQFDTENKKLRGFETLIRMKDITGNIIRPDVFIPISEQSDLIIDIDQWVLNTALSTFKKFIDKYHPDIMLSINISVIHIHDSSFIDNIKSVLETTQFPPENLEIEVTESVLISSVDETIEKLMELKKMGIAIALDDFGTGYASLSYLKTLPIDLLKIDKSFIDNVENCNDEKDFVKAIISMGHIMHYSVISEGVENSRQLEILKELDCDHIQGFLWGRPVNAEDAEKIISEYSTCKIK